MPRINILTATTLGVDGKTNPLFLGNKKLHWATNLAFEEGVIRTRPGIRYSCAVAHGQFQGAGEYRPSMGLSSAPFTEDTVGVVIVVDGDIFINCDKITTSPHFKLKGDVEVYQAENYLIFQNPESSTFWWDGVVLTASPGMQEQDWNDPDLPRTDAEIVRPVGAPGTCGGAIGGGGCNEQGTVTFTIISNLDESLLDDVQYSITVNENIAYEGIIAGSTLVLVMEEGVYDYRFVSEGYVDAIGVVSVVECTEQKIDIRLELNFPEWENFDPYVIGDVVEFEGLHYICGITGNIVEPDTPPVGAPDQWYPGPPITNWYNVDIGVGVTGYQLAWYGGILYQCISPPLGGFPGEYDGWESDWPVYSPYEFRGVWSVSTYSIGEVVKCDNLVYTCITQHVPVSAINRPGTGSSWELYWVSGLIE